MPSHSQPLLAVRVGKVVKNRVRIQLDLRRANNIIHKLAVVTETKDNRVDSNKNNA